VVGAPTEDVPGTTGHGVAHLHRWDGSGWSREAALHSPLTNFNGFFGIAVAAGVDRVVIGASQDRHPINNSISGCAHVFERVAGTWTRTATLAASDGVAFDQSGGTVALDGDLIAVGARPADVSGINDLGAVYVFARQGSSWVQQAKLLPADAADGHLFATSISASGDRVVVGDPYADTPTPMSGAVYLYSRVNGAWSQSAKLTSANPALHDELGWSVDIQGDEIVAGSPFGPNAMSVGRVRVFGLVNGTWAETATLVAQDTATPHQFGYSVSISGDELVVGAYGHPPISPYPTGAFYSFRRVNGAWIEKAMYFADDPQPGSNFTRRIACSLGRAVVSAPFADDETLGLLDVGAAYVFSIDAPVDTICAGATTLQGCQPRLTSTGLPSASSPSGFTIALHSADGLRTAALFYGISGRTWLDWSGFNASQGFLCVRAPTQRLGAQSTGGTSTLCDGALALDWNAYRAAHPTALGQPFAAGDVVNAQAWLREPPATKGAVLSNALEFVVQP
jgi:hypothetical protein